MSTSVPGLHVSSFSKVEGRGTVFIQNRQSGGISGKFTVTASVSFDAASDYPTGSLSIKTDLNDGLNATYKSTTIELINSYGRQNPTLVLTGRCDILELPQGPAPAPKGCKYWIMIANNKKSQEQGTPDIVGFVVIDRTGNRVAYGTGPLESGDFVVAPS